MTIEYGPTPESPGDWSTGRVSERHGGGIYILVHHEDEEDETHWVMDGMQYTYPDDAAAIIHRVNNWDALWEAHEQLKKEVRAWQDETGLLVAP